MGIGLLRAEHMFLQKERLPVVREMLLAATDAKNLEAESSQLRKELESATGEKRAQLEQRLNDVLGRMEGPMGHYRGAIERILPIIQDDCEQIFRVMQGKPVTIRLMDPPMHEFLPDHDALLEEVVMRDGAMANAQLTNYLVPTTMDTPEIDAVILDNPYVHGPFGAKGVGELPIDGPAPAIVNAIRHLGLDVRAIPATPERILEAAAKR